MKELVCIVCPRGCRLQVDEEKGYAVSGNNCPRGEQYGKNELLAPARVVTSTVRITGARLPRCPVKTAGTVPKGKMFEVMAALEHVVLTAPVCRGQIVLSNVCGTGVDVVATRGL